MSARELAYVRAECVGRRVENYGWRKCGWAGTLQRGPLDECPSCPCCGGYTVAVGNTAMSAVPDRRCGCGPDTVQVECPYHGGAI